MKHSYNRTKIKNNRTKKHTTYHKKTLFVKSIIREWLKQTQGTIQKDNSEYKDDYYLAFNKRDSYNNHLHLILKGYKNGFNNIIYVMKKEDTDTKKVVHSHEIKISIFSQPSIVVSNMIQRYLKFYGTIK